MLLNLTELSSEPLHEQISRQVAEKITMDELAAGSVLLRANTLAREQRVSVNTVKRAYDQLEKHGFVEAKPESGYYISELTTEEKQNLARRKMLNNELLFNELNMARKIQKDLLPKVLPDNDKIQMAAYWQPCHFVGGDFYDYIQLDDRRFGLVIADACGKGLPAAMLSSQIQAMLKSELNNGNGIHTTLQNMNRQLVDAISKDKFATLFFGVFDSAVNEFEYATAGHNYPILMTKDGNFQCLQTGGPALGLHSGSTFRTDKIRLNPGDFIFFYTDGVTETMNAQRQEYGERLLLNVLSNSRALGPQDILDAVLVDLDKFQHKQSSNDDRTMMVLKVTNQLKLT